jgi:tetratricopeptide (TPR) repeat protein
MAKIKERTRKEEIVVEEVEGGSSINDFISNNQNLLIAVGVVIILVVAGLIYMSSRKESANAQANADMFNAIYYFEEDSLNKALNGDGINYSLLDVIDEYGNTDAGEVARYYAGVAYLKQGDLESGIDELESVSAGDNTLGFATYVALAFAYEDQGNPAKAASLFEKAANTPVRNEQTSPLLFLHAGQNYEAAGEINKARKVYEIIRDEYPLSTEGRDIEKYLGRVAQ